MEELSKNVKALDKKHLVDDLLVCNITCIYQVSLRNVNEQTSIEDGHRTFNEESYGCINSFRLMTT